MCALCQAQRWVPPFQFNAIWQAPHFRIHTTPFEIILWRSIFHLQILCNWKGRKDLLWKKRHYILHPFSKLAKTLPADNFFYREYFPIKRGTSISRGKEFVTYFYLINNSDLKKIGNQNFSHNFFCLDSFDYQGKINIRFISVLHRLLVFGRPKHQLSSSKKSESCLIRFGVTCNIARCAFFRKINRFDSWYFGLLVATRAGSCVSSPFSNARQF